MMWEVEKCLVILASPSSPEKGRDLKSFTFEIPEITDITTLGGNLVTILK